MLQIKTYRVDNEATRYVRAKLWQFAQDELTAYAAVALNLDDMIDCLFDAAHEVMWPCDTNLQRIIDTDFGAIADSYRPEIGWRNEYDYWPDCDAA